MTNREEEVEAFLEHFGVKGMKWGRRKSGSTALGVGVTFIASNKLLLKAPISIALGAAAGVATNKLLTNRANKKISDIG